MLIINADDFGRSQKATDQILSCYKKGCITSTSAMVFMPDSQRAAELAKGMGIDVGLHLNFTQKISQKFNTSLFIDYHNRIVQYLTRTNYNYLIFNHTLHNQFKYVFQTQLEEFERIYKKKPSHLNGHHHMHLCSNMLIGGIIPEGQRIRRNFTYDKGEKSMLKRIYRKFLDHRLEKKYLMADYLFSLPETLNFQKIEMVYELAKTFVVELETHPEDDKDFNWLNKNALFLSYLNIDLGNYAELVSIKNI